MSPTHNSTELSTALQRINRLQLPPEERIALSLAVIVASAAEEIAGIMGDYLSTFVSQDFSTLAPRDLPNVRPVLRIHREDTGK